MHAGPAWTESKGSPLGRKGGSSDKRVTPGRFFFKGATETFESYYRKQRSKQARLALQPPSNMVSLPWVTGGVGLGPPLQRLGFAPAWASLSPTPVLSFQHETLGGYRKYFNQIVG